MRNDEKGFMPVRQPIGLDIFFVVSLLVLWTHRFFSANYAEASLFLQDGSDRLLVPIMQRSASMLARDAWFS